MSPTEIETEAEARWQPYPLSSPVTPFSPRIVDDQRFKLYSIAADLLPAVLGGSPDDSPLPGHVAMHPVANLDRLGNIEQALSTWHRDLPSKALIDTEANAAGPVLDLQ